MLLATIRSLYLGMHLSPITSVHHCKGLARIYHLHVCFGRARFADEGKNCTEHLHKAYLIDNLYFALWLLFWRRLERSARYIHFLRRLQWEMIVLCFLKFSVNFILCLNVFFHNIYVFTCHQKMLFFFGKNANASFNLPIRKINLVCQDP